MAFDSLNKLPLNVSYHKPKKLKGSSSPECPPSGQDHQSWRLDIGNNSTKVVTTHSPGDAKLRQSSPFPEEQGFGGQ